jgi:predicted PurR-regulated permease PerM
MSSFPLYGLFVLALFYTVYFARSILLPLAMALFLALLLRPVIRLLNRLRIPTIAGAALVLLLVLSLAGYGVFNLSDPALEWVDRAPETMRLMGEKLERILSPFKKAGKTAEELRKITEGTKGKAEVTVKAGPGFAETIVTGMQRFFAQATVMFILLFFLLASGDLFLFKLMKLYPKERKQQVADVVLEVERSISRYLLTVTLINIGEGVFVGIGMYLIGMPDPLLWGTMAAFLVFIPYLGPLVGIVIVTIVALLAVNDIAAALLAPLIYLVITTIQGQFLTPMILGARFAMNPVAIFVWLILWGVLWGVIGAIMAVPMLTILKILSDRIDTLRPLSEFLSD